MAEQDKSLFEVCMNILDEFEKKAGPYLVNDVNIPGKTNYWREFKEQYMTRIREGYWRDVGMVRGDEMFIRDSVSYWKAYCEKNNITPRDHIPLLLAESRLPEADKNKEWLAKFADDLIRTGAWMF